jgi:hypothetical protein
MKTFNQKLKTLMIDEIKAHQEADQIIQGTYGKENGKWKGCAVGCSIHSLNLKLKKDYSTSDHSVYETAFGIPSELAYLEDELFEEMEIEDAKKWPLRFMQAIPVKTDLSHVIAKFVIWQFEDKKYGLKNIKEVKEDKEAYGFCEEVVSLYKRSLTEEVPEKEYYELYFKIKQSWAGDWAWDWDWAWAWAGAWAGEEYKKNILISADKLLEIIEGEGV